MMQWTGQVLHLHQQQLPLAPTLTLQWISNRQQLGCQPPPRRVRMLVHPRGRQWSRHRNQILQWHVMPGRLTKRLLPQRRRKKHRRQLHRREPMLEHQEQTRLRGPIHLGALPHLCHLHPIRLPTMMTMTEATLRHRGHHEAFLFAHHCREGEEGGFHQKMSAHQYQIQPQEQQLLQRQMSAWAMPPLSYQIRWLQAQDQQPHQEQKHQRPHQVLPADRRWQLPEQRRGVQQHLLVLHL